jgi:hypothetical protein
VEDAALRSADVLAYFDLRPNLLYRAAPSGAATETTLFIGFVALAIALPGLLWLRRSSGPRSRLERWLGLGVWGCLGLGLLMILLRRPIGPEAVTTFAFSGVGVLLLVLILARHAAEGWRRRDTAWPLTEREWAGILLGLAAWAFLLSLGPLPRVAGEPLGSGLHGWLYPMLLPLHAVRFITRFGILVVFAVAFLAGLGVKWLDRRLPARARWPVCAALTLVLLAEYASFPLRYEAVAGAARPVDRVIGADPDDVAVLEVPTSVPSVDGDAMLWSLAHGKLVVNGFAGFDTPYLRELSGLLLPEGPSFPSPAALAALRTLYPLRYLVVRTEDRGMPPDLRQAWLGVRQSPPPDLRFRGSFGGMDLYELVRLPERGASIPRAVSYRFLLEHRWLRFVARPLSADARLEQWVEVWLNGKRLERAPLSAPITVTVRLGRRLYRVAPNVIEIRHGYRQAVEASTGAPIEEIGLELMEFEMRRSAAAAPP